MRKKEIPPESESARLLLSFNFVLCSACTIPQYQFVIQDDGVELYMVLAFPKISEGEWVMMFAQYVCFACYS